MSHLSIPLEDISLVTLSRTVYIEDISSIRWNDVDISNSLPNKFPQGNPEYIALSRLREYKNREGINIYNNLFYRTINGRESRKPINFNTINYEQRKMRRKAETLRYKDNMFVRPINQPIKIISQTQLKQLKQLRTIETITACNTQKGSCSNIIYDTNIPFEDKL